MGALFATSGASGTAVGTATITAADDTLTFGAAHNLVDGQQVVTSSPTLGAIGVLVPNAPYFVANATATTMQLRPSAGGLVMAFATDGTVSVDAAEAVNTGKQLRQALGGLFYKGRAASPDTGRFGARPGIIPNNSTNELSISGFTVTVNDTNCTLNPVAGGTTGGPYLCAIPGTALTVTAAHATLPRKDIVIARMRDTQEDSTGFILADAYILDGTAAGVPVAPNAPSGECYWATIDVPAQGGGNPTLTYDPEYTVAAGGILPVATTAKLPAAWRREGVYADQADTDALMRFSGSAWQAVATKTNNDYVQLLTGGAAVTGPTTYTPVVTGQGTATFSTLTGRWMQIAPKLKWWYVYMVVSANGSGASVLQVTSPTNPNRAIGRQNVLMKVTNAASPSSRLGTAETFTTGTGAVWDRMLWDNGGAANGLENMDGSKLITGMLIVIQGEYWEA